MKADKGKSFVVMDRSDYDNKMETAFFNLLNDKSTYEAISTSPFRRIERELNTMFLSLKRQQKIDEPTYTANFIQLIAHHQRFAALLSTIKKGTL